MKPVSKTFAPMEIQQGIHLASDFIKIKDPWDTFKILGAFVVPDGNVYIQVETLYDKAKHTMRLN